MALAGTEIAGTIPEHCKSVSFAPAHVSTLFHIHPDDDPLLHGSTGLGICLPQGTYAAVEREPAKRTSISFTEGGHKVKDPVTRRAVELALDGPEKLSFWLRRELPVGTGMGMSGATALAACLELGVGLERATRAAHQSEIEHSTGLGDVMAQAAALRDGPGTRLVQRRTPGVGGDVLTWPVDGQLALCLCGGGRNTSDVLKDDGWHEIINSAATAHPLPPPTLRAFLKAGRLFSELAGLMSPESATALAELPMGAVGTVAHLGTAVVMTDEDVSKIATELEQFGEVRIY